MSQPPQSNRFVLFEFRSFRSVRTIAGPGGVSGPLPTPKQRCANHRRKSSQKAGMTKQSTAASWHRTHLVAQAIRRTGTGLVLSASFAIVLAIYMIQNQFIDDPSRLQAFVDLHVASSSVTFSCILLCAGSTTLPGERGQERQFSAFSLDDRAGLICSQFLRSLTLKTMMTRQAW